MGGASGTGHPKVGSQPIVVKCDPRRFRRRGSGIVGTWRFAAPSAAASSMVIMESGERATKVFIRRAGVARSEAADPL